MVDGSDFGGELLTILKTLFCPSERLAHDNFLCFTGILLMGKVGWCLRTITNTQCSPQAVAACYPF